MLGTPAYKRDDLLQNIINKLLLYLHIVYITVYTIYVYCSTVVHTIIRPYGALVEKSGERPNQLYIIITIISEIVDMIAYILSFTVIK